MAMLAILLTAEPLGVIRLPGRITGLGALVSGILAVSYLGFGVAATHDYLAWNRQRWAAATSLMAAGTATPADIRGGYAFDGYYAWVDLPPGTGLTEAEWRKAKESAVTRLPSALAPGSRRSSDSRSIIGSPSPRLRSSFSTEKDVRPRVTLPEIRPPGALARTESAPGLPRRRTDRSSGNPNHVPLVNEHQ